MQRLFFGFEVEAPWPQKWPKGRVIEKASRHITLAFMPEAPLASLLDLKDRIPLPPFKVGSVGVMEKLLYLPHRHPHVIAFEPKLTKEKEISAYQRLLIEWLQSNGFDCDEKPFLPHITIARAPFHQKDWEARGYILPCLLRRLHLYQSMGGLKYEKRWSHAIESPFEELDHTADIAFLIKGASLEELYIHAKTALAFREPSLLAQQPEEREIKRLQDIIALLNRQITLADIKTGCAIKSVSHHGDLIQKPDHLEWQMIVDI